MFFNPFACKSVDLPKFQIVKIREIFPIIKMQHMAKNTCFCMYKQKCHIVAFLLIEILKNRLEKIFSKKNKKIRFWEKKGDIGRYEDINVFNNHS